MGILFLIKKLGIRLFIAKKFFFTNFSKANCYRVSQTLGSVRVILFIFHQLFYFLWILDRFKIFHKKAQIIFVFTWRGVAPPTVIIYICFILYISKNICIEYIYYITYEMHTLYFMTSYSVHLNYIWTW